jgi:CRISPR-associated protein Cas1
VEGTAAHRYFAAFAEMLHPDERETATFDLEGRNRRPPRDPVNALLSLAYAMLTREWTVVLFSVGFDPYLGFYHQPRYGRPALALDLMEEYRPLIADSLVLTVVNNGERGPSAPCR